jgi:hypothetical protein
VGGLRIFFITTEFRTALGSSWPPIQWLPGVLSVRVKRPGREADHSPPYRAEVKKCVALCPPLPQYALMAWCSAKKKKARTGTTLPFTFTVFSCMGQNVPFSKEPGYWLNVGVLSPLKAMKFRPTLGPPSLLSRET